MGLRWIWLPQRQNWERYPRPTYQSSKGNNINKNKRWHQISRTTHQAPSQTLSQTSGWYISFGSLWYITVWSLETIGEQETWEMVMESKAPRAMKDRESEVNVIRGTMELDEFSLKGSLQIVKFRWSCLYSEVLKSTSSRPAQLIERRKREERVDGGRKTENRKGGKEKRL